MAITAGSISKISSDSTSAKLAVSEATAGTAPYSRQWYRSTTTGFTIGAGFLIAGATALTLNDTALAPNTTYYYKVTQTDQVPTTVTTTQLAVVTTQLGISQNAFQLSSILGMTDLKFNGDTIACQVDVSQATPLFPGSAVKMVDSADGIPKIVGCAVIGDDTLGFINYNIKNASFVAGMPVEISQAGNVMYLYAASAIPRGSRVTLADPVLNPGSVTVLVGSSGGDLIGYALDKATATGALIRVKLRTPSFLKA